MLNRSALLSLATISALTFAVFADAKLDNVKCLFSDKPAKEANSVEYKKGKVYFCCENCPKNFSADPKKHAVKANQQLVKTAQYTQKGCPLSGEKVDTSTKVTLNGVDVCFCCKDCKGAYEKAEGDEAKAKMIFEDAAFDKGFELAKK